MKSSFKLAGAMLLMASSAAAFAATQPAAQSSTHTPTAAHATTPSKTDLKAERRQINADEHAALAACKNMKAADKSTCRKDAIAKASNARAHLKAAKHS